MRRTLGVAAALICVIWVVLSIGQKTTPAETMYDRGSRRKLTPIPTEPSDIFDLSETQPKVNVALHIMSMCPGAFTPHNGMRSPFY